VFDEVEALSAGLVGDVEGCSTTPFHPSLKDGVVLGVDGMAWELVIVCPSRYLPIGA
jgi:hypothetical protein